METLAEREARWEAYVTQQCAPINRVVNDTDMEDGYADGDAPWQEDLEEEYTSLDELRDEWEYGSMCDDCNQEYTEQIPNKVWVALEVIKTQHNNQVTGVAFDVIYKYLKEEN